MREFSFHDQTKALRVAPANPASPFCLIDADGKDGPQCAFAPFVFALCASGLTGSVNFRPIHSVKAAGAPFAAAALSSLPRREKTTAMPVTRFPRRRPLYRCLFSGILGVFPAAGWCATDGPTLPHVAAVSVRTRVDAPAVSKPKAAESENRPATQGPLLSLADCIAIAMERQPAVAAARADLQPGGSSKKKQASCDDEARGLFKGLAARRKQAALGRDAAGAALDVAERETVYAVTRTYFTVLFAREQRRVAQGIVDQLGESLRNAQLLLGKEGAPRDLTQNAVDRNKVFLELARTRLVDAEQGIERAKAALREAMGVGCDFCFDVPPIPMPTPVLTLCRDEVVALAVSRRGEMAQAVIAERVTELEVQAQEKACGIKKMTFAAAADLHAKPVPAGVADGEYRPGALGVEMPVFLIGTKKARVEHAEALLGRAHNVVDKTRGLVALEAEDMFLRWEGAARKLAKSGEAADLADKVAQDTLNDFKGGQAVNYREVLESAVIAAQTRAQYNEIRFQNLLTLAGLDRVTAGGFHAPFDNVGQIEQVAEPIPNRQP